MLNNEPLLLSVKNDIKVYVPNSINLLTTYIVLEQDDWFETELDFIRQYIKPNMNIIDIGANYGLYTLNFAKCLNAQGKILAFEPTPNTVQYLSKSIKKNNIDNIQLYDIALSNRKGKTSFYTNDNSELNSISVQDENSHETSIQIDTLDNIMNNYNEIEIDFIKLDAEGEETNIVDGAKKVLNEHDPLIMFEYKHGHTINTSLLNKFQEIGYILLRHVPGLNILCPVIDTNVADDFQLNLFCCKKSRLDQLIKSDVAIENYPDKVEISDENNINWETSLIHTFHSDLFEHMKSSCNNITSQSDISYMQAINYYCIAKDSSLPARDKYALLQLAFGIMQSVIETPVRVEYLLSYSRVALDLGFRSICLSTLKLIHDNFKIFKNAQSVIPYIPTKDSNYKYREEKPLMDSIYLKNLENILKLQAFSSYFLNGSDFDNLNALIINGCSDNEILRRYLLSCLKNNHTINTALCEKLSVKSKENLNPEFWSSLLKKNCNT